MFEISQLKEKKLSELQDIAKELNVPKYRALKKLDLVYQILDQQAANPTAVANVVKPAQQEEKNPKARIQKPKRNQPKVPPRNQAPKNVSKIENGEQGSTSSSN